MAKLSTPIVFKWYNRRLLPSSNGRTGETYVLQTTKLLAPMAKPSTLTVFKLQNCQTYYFQVTKSSTSTVFKCQPIGTSFLQMAIPSTHTLSEQQCIRHLLSSNGNTVDAYSLRTAMYSTSTVFKWQYRRRILSPNSNVFDIYCLQMAIPYNT